MPSRWGDVALRRLVYFSEETAVTLALGRGVAFMSQQCAPCSANPQVVREPHELRILYDFEPGLHEVILFFDKGDRAYLRMSAQRPYKRGSD